MRSQVSSVSVGATTTFVLGGSYARVGIIFHPPPNNRITLGNDSVVVLDQGPTLQQAQAPLVLRRDVHGDAVQMPWNAISNLAGTQLGITEIFGDWPLMDASGQAAPMHDVPLPNYPAWPIANNPRHS